MYTLNVFDMSSGEFLQDTVLCDTLADAYFEAAKVAGLYEDADWEAGEDRGDFVTFRHGFNVHAIAIDEVEVVESV